MLLHHILGQHFGVCIGVRITLDYRRCQRVQCVLIEALGELHRIVGRHGAAVELLLDVSHVAVCECRRYMHQCLPRRGYVLGINERRVQALIEILYTNVSYVISFICYSFPTFKDFKSYKFAISEDCGHCILSLIHTLSAKDI